LSTTGGAVFISYASEDSAAAQRITEALRLAGIEVWFDRSELRGGDAWDRHIHRQIRDCRLFIAVISTHTDARDEGYFRREWRLAIDRTLDMDENKAFIVPVVIDGTSERTTSVPEAFHHVQWTRLAGGETNAYFISHIVKLIGAASAATETARAGLAPAVSTQLARRRWPVRALLTVVVVLALAGSGWLGWRNHWIPGLAGGAATKETSIAVLPLADMSEQHDQQYFGDGLAEEILNVLDTIPGLRVIGRSSSFQFRGTDLDLRKVGRTLGVRYLVEGSVRKSGRQLKVTVQLVDATDGSTRWSDTYEPSAADTLTLQRKIATAVARALRMSVLEYFSGSGTQSQEAHDLYLRGIRDTDSQSEQAVRRSVTELVRAVEIDPAYVDGWVALANAYDNMATTSLAPYAEFYGLARGAIDKALTLDPRNADAYSMRAFVRMNQYDWQGAEDDINKSLALHKSLNAIEASAKLAAARGDLNRAVDLLQEVLATDPLDLYALSVLAYPLYPALGRYADANQLFEKIRDVNPGVLWLNSDQAVVAWWMGDHARAMRLAEAETDSAGRQLALAQLYAAGGKKNLSDKALGLALQDPTVTNFGLACVYAFRGEGDLAFRELDKSYQHHSPELLVLQSEPALASLRRDPRYGALLRRLNLPERAR
jgi:TolB-like protein/Tfp pilus assembly protein PilF